MRVPADFAHDDTLIDMTFALPGQPALTARRTLGEIKAAPVEAEDALRAAQHATDDGRPADAIAIYAEAARRWGDDPTVLNAAAWYLLDTAPADQRDPKTALPWAAEAAKLTECQDAAILDTWALALWLNGQRTEGARRAAEAAKLAPDDEEITGRAKRFADDLKANPAVEAEAPAAGTATGTGTAEIEVP